MFRTDFVQPICLPTPDDNFPINFRCEISGWGAKHETDCKFSCLDTYNKHFQVFNIKSYLITIKKISKKSLYKPTFEVWVGFQR